MNKKLVVALFVMQILGFGSLYAAIYSQQQNVYIPVVQSNPQDPSSKVSVAQVPVDAALRDGVQVVLKQELTPYLHQMASQESGARDSCSNSLKTSSVVKQNTPVNILALQSSTSIVDSAIAQGNFTAEQSSDLQKYANQLTSEQREKLLDRIGRAVIEQRLDMHGNWVGL